MVKYRLGNLNKHVLGFSVMQEHRELAREVVRKSLVLLKNGKSTKKVPKILVAGTHADNLGYQCGGWTIEWQGASGKITVGMFMKTNSYY